MFSNFFVTILNTSTVIVGGGGEPAATQAAEAAATGSIGGMFGSIGPTTILLYAGLIAVLWFFMLRPQRKREKEMREMQSALKVGDDIVTSSGMFGVITAVGEDCFVVEFGTNKGVRIPVRKADIIGIKTPSLVPVKESLEK